MTNTVGVGAQWGDEGKAKIIDCLASEADWVVRYQGGDNAGHTAEATLPNGKDVKFVSHALPAGALHDGKKCVIGNGVVLFLDQLLKEIEEVESFGISIRDRLFISDSAHVIFPYNRLIDSMKDAEKGKCRIGTTSKGIGPTYSDKMLRTGIRVGDLLDPDYLITRLEALFRDKNEQLAHFNLGPIDVGNLVEYYHSLAMQFKDRIVDTVYLLDEARRDKDDILFEGAQGTFLDIDHGTYPFVTSSNATAGGACTGAGVGPTLIDHVIGVLKAYITRVGEGGFPTELGSYDSIRNETRDQVDQTLLGELKHKINERTATDKEIGMYLRGVGMEFGATTGRPRRTGWLDMVMARKAAIVNGLDSIALTKLDVLDGLEQIKLCVGYEINGEEINQFPNNPNELPMVCPVYETLDGWEQSTREVRHYIDLPGNSKKYIRRIEELTETPVSIISVGPRRDQTIMRL